MEPINDEQKQLWIDLQYLIESFYYKNGLSVLILDINESATLVLTRQIIRKLNYKIIKTHSNTKAIYFFTNIPEIIFDKCIEYYNASFNEEDE